MIITEIKRKGKSELYYIYTDDELYGFLQAEFIVKHKLKTGLEIDRQELDKIKVQSDRLSCAAKALNYVSKMIKSEFQVRQYLKKSGFMDEAIDEAIEKLKSYGYINDEQVAIFVVQSLEKRKGKNFIRQDLLQKGIKKEQIERLLDNLSGQDETCLEVAKKWLKTRVLPLSQNDKAKLYRFLVGKGFEFDMVRRVLSKIEIGGEDDWY